MRSYILSFLMVIFLTSIVFLNDANCGQKSSTEIITAVSADNPNNNVTIEFVNIQSGLSGNLYEKIIVYRKISMTDTFVFIEDNNGRVLMIPISTIKILFQSSKGIL